MLIFILLYPTLISSVGFLMMLIFFLWEFSAKASEIEARAESELPEKDQMILVYCRSGRRSKLAAEILVELGYTNIYEFGGIIDWPYETE